MKRNLIIGGVALALLLISIKFFPYHCNCRARGVGTAVVLPVSTRTGEVALGTPSIELGSTTVAVDLADTPALRAQGLSGRTALPEGSGMLFVFDAPGQYGFWMKDMNFPIDIVWISPEGGVVGVEQSLAPSTYPKIYYPPRPVKWVVELPAGFAAAHGISAGSPFSLVTHNR